ncbi:MFS transporter [Sphingobium sp. CR2-8]|uniref:spinster family MFS transporter n=1 Tax=Sphingobium sp. CR2-8 TaxID=1306534 RepID=UPI002DB6A107|nr:MFS transporter [Sphingobium sp. CR2-8]MEC3909513.1 MFS transporter [Sphingobium sp. CR2-8]
MRTITAETEIRLMGEVASRHSRRERGMGEPHEAVTRKHSNALILGVLCLITMLSQADRVIMSVAGEAVKVSLNLTDTQLGWLGGLAFTVLYSIMAIPIARIAERVDRWRLLTACLLFWSVMTALCGAARNFTHLFMARAGVGIGEAGCSPTAQSLVADYFGSERRTTAIAILMSFISVGGVVGAVAGGQIVEHLGWREAFWILGAAGIVLALICFILFRDPFRGSSNDIDNSAEAVPSLLSVCRIVLGTPQSRHIVIAAALVLIASFSFAQFSAPYFIRRYGLGFGDAGLMYGVTMGVSGALGSIMGGMICDRLRWLGMARFGLVPAAGMLIAAPLFIIGFQQPTVLMAAAFIAPAAVLKMLYVGPTFGLVHEMVAPRMRATASALVFMIIGLVGGMGPLLTGFIIDFRAAGYFSSQLHGSFVASCPGGRAPPGSGEALVQACSSSLSSATSDALVATSIIMLWAAIHYLYAGWRLWESGKSKAA